MREAGLFLPLAMVASAGDAVSGALAFMFMLVFLGVIVAAAIWFFRGPATAAERYVDALAAQLNPQDAALFRNVYRTKDPRSTTVAWILTAFLTPTISYLYQGRWALAAISFVTFQGFLIWYFVALFTMPMEVLSRNKRLADEAINQVMIGRGGTGQFPGQVINVNQYAHPYPYPGPTQGQPQPAQPQAYAPVMQPPPAPYPPVQPQAAPYQDADYTARRIVPPGGLPMPQSDQPPMPQPGRPPMQQP